MLELYQLSMAVIIHLLSKDIRAIAAVINTSLNRVYMISAKSFVSPLEIGLIPRIVMTSVNTTPWSVSFWRAIDWCISHHVCYGFMSFKRPSLEFTFSRYPSSG